MSAKGIVYAFIDDAGIIRYVGKTTDALQRRIRGHLRDSERPVTKFHVWLRAQVDAGAIPKVIVIERVEAPSLDEREQFHIRANEATVYNTSHVVSTEEARAARAEREAKRQAEVVANAHPCRKDMSFQDSDWDEVADPEIKPNWHAIRRQYMKLGNCIMSERKGVAHTHAHLARLALIHRDEDADKVLIAAILADWVRDYGCLDCSRWANRAHLSEHTRRGLNRVWLTSRARAKDLLPDWHWKVTERTEACDMFDALDLDLTHAVIGPRGILMAIMSAARGYSSHIIADMCFDVHGCGERIFSDDNEERRYFPQATEKRQEKLRAMVAGMGARP